MSLRWLEEAGSFFNHLKIPRAQSTPPARSQERTLAPLTEETSSRAQLLALKGEVSELKEVGALRKVVSALRSVKEELIKLRSELDEEKKDLRLKALTGGVKKCMLLSVRV